MEDVWTAARRFAAAPPVINVVDLGLALVLEYFAWPLLVWVPYTRLAKRNLFSDPQVLASWVVRLRACDAADHPQLLELIGAGLYQRWLLQRRANRMSLVALVAVIALQVLLVAAIVLSSRPVWLVAGWFCAVGFATLVCVTDRHWRSPRGFRGTSG